MNKIKNSIAFDAYEKMIEGSKKCKETLDFNDSEHGDFNNGVFILMKSCESNPFAGNIDASNLFSDMKYNYKKILAKGIDKKVSRRRLMKCAWDLCQLNIENPFEKEPEIVIKKEEIEKEVVTEDKKEKHETVSEIDQKPVMIFNEDEKNKIEKKPDKKGKFSKLFDHKED